MALGLLALGLNSVRAQDAFAARTSSGGTALLAPFYWIPSTGAGFATSSGSSAAPGAPTPNYSFYHTASTVTVGNGWGITDTSATAVGDGKNIIYKVEISFPGSNCSTDLIVGLSSANCAIGGVAHGTIAACTAMQSAYVANIWSLVCYVTNNVGVTQPDIGFKYVSGANNRAYCTVARFTQVGAPCQNAGACGILGPVSTNQAYVTVTGVTNATDLAVLVYEKTNGVENPNPIGILTSGIVVGNNQVPVTWDADSVSAQLLATQITPGGQEGCHSYSGAYVVGSGPNPKLYVSLNCRTSKGGGAGAGLNNGPVGMASDSTSGGTSLFFMPGPLNSTQLPQNSGILLTPSTNWQTIVIDPRTVQKGWVWSGFDSGGALSAQDNVGAWAGLESLIFQQGDNDTGPIDILIDNVYSGPDLLVNFENDWANSASTNYYNTSTGAVYSVFYNPTNGYSGYPVGYSEGPNSALVLSNQFAVSGTNVEELEWQWSGYGADAWFRCLFLNGAQWNYPQIHMDAPFQFDILLLPKGATTAYAVGTAPPIADQTNCPGTPFTVTVNVTPPYDTTTGLPLTRNYTYQWKKNGTAIGTAPQSSYTIASPVTADAGTYSVVVGDGSGNTLARQMILTIPSVLSIDTQPTDQGPMCIGSTASFSIGASISALCPCGNNPPLTYQWYFNGTAIADATDSSYSFNGLTVDVTNAGSYTCVVSNTCASQAVTSSVGKLYVCDCSTSPVYNTLQSGLLGLYYTNRLYTSANPFADPVTETRVDAPVNFDWGTGSFDAGNYPNATDYFCVRWVGTIQGEYPGQTYTFHTTTDDGVRLYVDGNLIINKWSPQSATTLSGTYVMPANPVDIIMEYFENAGSAVAELSWEGACTVSNIIPNTALNAADPGALPPFIILTAPANNSSGPVGTPVTLSASVTQESAAGSGVQFYNGATQLATAPGTGSGTYSTSWTPTATGVYNIYAQVQYGTSSKLNSVAVNKLTITNAAVVVTPVTIKTGAGYWDGSSVTVSYSGGSGSTFVLYTNNVCDPAMTNWTPVATNTATPGSFSVPAVGAGNGVYYRVRSQ